MKIAYAFHCYVAPMRWMTSVAILGCLIALPREGMSQPRPVANTLRLQPKSGEPTPPSTYRLYQPVQKPLTGFKLGFEIGQATFQDIQAPVSDDLNLRVDGTNVAQDSSGHTGLMLAAKLGYDVPHSLGTSFIEAMAARAASSYPVGSPRSSYLVYSLQGGSWFNVASHVELPLAVELRRTQFRNTDNGHYVDGVILKSGARVHIDQWSLAATGGAAPYAQAGYTQTGNGGGSLANTQTSLMTADVNCAYHFDRASSVHAGFVYEQIQMSMNDLSGYRNLGISVRNDADGSTAKTYQLSSSVFQLGAVRKF
jgi:hypothetical protein